MIAELDEKLEELITTASSQVKGHRAFFDYRNDILIKSDISSLTIIYCTISI